MEEAVESPPMFVELVPSAPPRVTARVPDTEQCERENRPPRFRLRRERAALWWPKPLRTPVISSAWRIMQWRVASDSFGCSA